MPRILLIDDDDTLRKIVAKSLVYAGHEVIQAADGKQGMDLIRTSPFDVVITDLIMPEQEGVETIGMLRTEFPGLPVIAISGGAIHSPLYLEIAAKIGARFVLAKPFHMPELIELVKTAIAARPAP